MTKIRMLVPVLLLCAISAAAQEASKLSPEVRVIDGAAAREDQTIVVRNGRIEALGAAAQVTVPADAKAIDLADHTVIPGLVGMHEHFFYPSGSTMPRIYNEMGFSAPRLYLAGGVTSLRTGGSIEPYTDLSLKKLIEDGKIAGPYLGGAGAFGPQLHELSGPDDARRTVDYRASEGVTSFKAYMHITRAALAAAIDAAHKHGLKITAHLCSIGFREAAAMGIDDLEHGLLVDTEFVPGKAPDICPTSHETNAALVNLDIGSAPVQEMIPDLIRHQVAVTSTLVVFETIVPNQALADRRNGEFAVAGLLAKEMQFESAFVKAGGLLIAGNDPTGYGGVLPGFGDQREVELLVEAGFTPVEAIRIASSNGAKFLGESDRIGTLAPGKQADMVAIRGNPAANISDIERVEIVFKDGVGYDSAKLIESVRGAIGLH